MYIKDKIRLRKWACGTGVLEIITKGDRNVRQCILGLMIMRLSKDIFY